MQLRVERKWFTGKSSMGQLLVDGTFECFTLEDCCRPGNIHAVKIPGQTAIPVGRYKVIVDRSTRFKRDLPHLLEVPGFEGIRIHPGNTDRDTEGCILVGTGRTPDALVESRKAFDALMAKLQGALAAGQRVTIDVVGEPTAPQAP